MKYLFILTTIICSFLISCGTDTSEALSKTWQVSDIETETDLADSVKSAMLLSSTMQFTKDGKYTTSGGIGADQGTYSLDENGKTLSTISTAGKNSDVYLIEDLDSDKLVLNKNGTKITCKALLQEPK
ncbi:MAG TPA: lipocalin family protein [Pedobacter sp.]|jgi:hypothetical protein